MKKSIATKWVKALRSGKYEQGTGRLRGDEGFCCLGVLCDLAVKAGVIEEPTMQYGIAFYGTDEDHDDENLPAIVMKWAGMKTDSGERKGTRVALTHLNDESMYSFDKIANVIEKEYQDL